MKRLGYFLIIKMEESRWALAMLSNSVVTRKTVKHATRRGATVLLTSRLFGLIFFANLVCAQHFDTYRNLLTLKQCCYNDDDHLRLYHRISIWNFKKNMIYHSLHWNTANFLQRRELKILNA